MSQDYKQATAEERAMARGFVTLWESVGVQDAEDWLYALRNRAELLASLDDDDSREAQDNTPSLGPFNKAARLAEIEALFHSVADQQAMPDDSWIAKWELLKEGLLAELTAAEVSLRAAQEERNTWRDGWATQHAQAEAAQVEIGKLEAVNDTLIEAWKTTSAFLDADRAKLTAAEATINQQRLDNLQWQAKVGAAEAERDRLKAENAVHVKAAMDNFFEHRHLLQRAEAAEAQLTATREALRQLVEKWRAASVPPPGPTCDGPWEGGAQVTFEQCADELEAALSPSAVQTPEEK